MCSSRGLCGARDRPRSSRSGSSGSGGHYALCALGVGLIALGIVMIVWTVIPKDAEASGGNASGNSSRPLTTGEEEEAEDADSDNTKTSSVAFVLVGAGLIMLLLSICLGLRSKSQPAESTGQRAAAAVGGAAYQGAASGEQPEEQAVAYDVPSYDEVVGSDTYPVRNSNLRNSMARLPSYEDILAAVENEGGAEPDGHAPSEGPASPDAGAGGAVAGAGGAVAGAGGAVAGAGGAVAGAVAPPEASDPTKDSGPAASANPPARSSSRASRILAPLRVRRIKSDKLHLKAFRLHIRSPTHNAVTIEPITPPPQYDDKPPDLG
ncbi:transmembrane protein 51b [Gadus macrocephalus]|uniref:transmembrane protein 51b n=1 Tax=Gadus macrocephalus TaxID=80720 RepID=UPI0028CB4A85|nr:transmembrane protein 51b [Gadus macrocephalus]XP_059925745.1 transmembrane protein 51b [Gadus macrocephalus]XP_059925746.1 transmembrane protein 51b [Gadus macrocephalus]